MFKVEIQAKLWKKFSALKPREITYKLQDDTNGWVRL